LAYRPAELALYCVKGFAGVLTYLNADQVLNEVATDAALNPDRSLAIKEPSGPCGE